MKRFYFLLAILFMQSANVFAQKIPNVLAAENANRCGTMEAMKEAISKDPSLLTKWKVEGEKKYSAYLQRSTLQKETGKTENEIIIPIVFHLVDDSSNQAWITDRDIYEQVEILNKLYSGKKAVGYKKVIPEEIYSLVGNTSVKFVLARRNPSGGLTSGIERRYIKSPGRIAIKSNSTDGLDAWDTNKYVNVWAGTFFGDDAGLLGIATFPFTTSEGPQGVVINIATLPYASNTNRSFYPAYSEGMTLAHELGHYFYLWHTFGDRYTCNNADFRIQPGWPLPNGAGPESDDTPAEKADSVQNAHFGNPSLDYSDGCTSLQYGEMYGSVMNYFDDRALFMISKGYKNRVEGCIELYRPGLKNSNGFIPPGPVTDAYLVSISPRGTPVRREYVLNNIPITATIRNNGTANLHSITIGVKLDNNSIVSKNFSVNLEPQADTLLFLENLNAIGGSHVLTVYSSAPDSQTDAFTNNDTIVSFIFVNAASISAPFTEEFSSGAFPPAGWQIWNPINNKTWNRNATSGYSMAGSATVENYNYNGGGQLDDLVTPAIIMGNADSALLYFKIAYGVYDLTDVSLWDGLELYISNNGGASYELVYKKTGNQLKTVPTAQKSSFTATPGSGNWKTEKVNLTPYLLSGEKLLIKFRNVNAYGNNIYLDDINVEIFSRAARDAFPSAILNVPNFSCDGIISPSVIFSTNGSTPLTTLKISYKADNGALHHASWEGHLNTGERDTVQFPELAGIAPGMHTLTFFTSGPDGMADEYLANDTIKKSIFIFDKIEAPVAEGFENATFPQAKWAVDNPDKSITWERTTNASDSGSASMVIRSFDYAGQSATDRFISSIITGNPKYDSVFVSFDYAYTLGANNNVGQRFDTLEIMVSSDCGKTKTTIWKKWGGGLQTTGGAADAGAGFVPEPSEWENINIPIYPIVGSNDYQVYFVAKSNHQNNLYIDNINIYGKTVPPLLKKQGYLLYPSPFKTEFIIRNYEDPVDFQRAAIYNSIGQLIWSAEFNGKAYKEVTVDFSGQPAGIYIVKLQYTNKTIIDRIVKQ